MNEKKVAVIGGGAAGLCAARHCTASDEVGGGVTVFEQTSQLGGTWVYTDATDTDQFGLPILTSMYKNLRTNLPKEVMGFPDFPIPEREESYIPGNDILRFLNDYADHFDLRKFVKFNHHVKKVAPKPEGKWEVEVLNLTNNQLSTDTFDAVMICSGHYHTPLYPEIKGLETFTGFQSHSHSYRKPDVYQGKSVLVIGGGPSGLDITLDISYFAEKVILSHHLSDEFKTKLPLNITQRPDVQKINGNTVFFKDGSYNDVNCILFCTGYLYSFPFLSEQCNILVDDNFVQPLYKHLINIHHPTMCFIGLPYYICTFMLYDLQVRVFLKLLSGKISLPNHEEMLADIRQEIKWRNAKGLKKKQFHMMGKFQEGYYNELSAFGNLPTIPSVYPKLHNESSRTFNDDLVNFRKNVYAIVDDNDFVQLK